uniref:Uncharacterized protein n=1 Tax=Anguilla anguilla TaxID=7936 RepID=A0A0E9Q8N8_ANGAN
MVQTAVLLTAHAKPVPADRHCSIRDISLITPLYISYSNVYQEYSPVRA